MEEIVPTLRGHALWLLGQAGMGKTLLGPIVAMVVSRCSGTFGTTADLDFFKGVPFSTCCPALYDDGSIGGHRECAEATLPAPYFLGFQQKEICFGKSQQWADVEATFDRKVVGQQVDWEQWCGIVQRGQPSTLVFHRLKPPAGKVRAPGPGAVRNVEWKPLAKKWLEGRRIILHMDSARSYKMKVPDVLRDRVAHKKKRVKVGTKFRWIAPKYVEMTRHKVPGSKKVIKSKSGAQIIDRCSEFLKARLNINQNCRVGSSLLLQLCSAQYEYWRRGQGLWVDTGVLVQWFMAPTVRAV
eukprot:Skav222613  [mRNA]  locus=scaffold1190:71147:72257:+ [translate_table: standard]